VWESKDRTGSVDTAYQALVFPEPGLLYDHTGAGSAIWLFTFDTDLTYFVLEFRQCCRKLVIKIASSSSSCESSELWHHVVRYENTNISEETATSSFLKTEILVSP
jgi:hypothetical protein